MEFDGGRLQDAHVMVVGCGALGNEVLKNLVLMGVGHLVTVDFDYVEDVNLTRSVLFRADDVGGRKVDAVRRRLLEINPRVEVETLFGDISYDVGTALVRSMDVVVGCVDSRWARYCIQRICIRAGRTWVDGGVLGLEGTARVFAPGRNCYACSLGEKGEEELRRRMPCSGVVRRSLRAGHAPVTPLISSIIGAVEAQEAIKVITGVGQEFTPRMFYYEGETLTVRTPEFGAWDDDCPLHEEEWVPEDGPVTFTVTSKVEEVVREGEILLSEPFVDYVINRGTGERYDVMVPAHRVEPVLENDPAAGGYPTGMFRAHEYDSVGRNFPYGELTLGEIGIPSRDILKLKTETGCRFVEIG